MTVGYMKVNFKPILSQGMASATTLKVQCMSAETHDVQTARPSNFPRYFFDDDKRGVTSFDEH